MAAVLRCLRGGRRDEPGPKEEYGPVVARSLVVQSSRPVVAELSDDLLAHIAGFLKASDFYGRILPVQYRRRYYEMIDTLLLFKSNDIPEACADFTRLCLMPVAVGIFSWGHGYGERVSIRLQRASALQCGDLLYRVRGGTLIRRDRDGFVWVDGYSVGDGELRILRDTYERLSVETTPGWH